MYRKLFLSLIFVLFAASFAYAEEVGVSVDGVAVEFADQGPVIIDGRTLIPARGVFEALGFDVEWNATLWSVTLTRGADTVLIYEQYPVFYVNGNSYYWDVPVRVINGRTMIPIRAVLESVGYNVGWDSATNTVLISSVPIVVLSDLPFNESVAAFSQELFRQALLSPVVDDENIVMSPLSAYYALAMVSLGANGETSDEFTRVLGRDPHELAPLLAALAENLMKTRGSTNLSVAGSVWLRDTFSVHPEFNRAMTDYFGAPAFPRDFDDGTTVNEINAWISENTNGLIDEVLSGINSDDIMFLINTLYMYAKWADAFRPMTESTRTFTPENGAAQQTAFLTAGGQSGTALRVNVTPACEAVLLPYDDGNLGFFMVRPTDGTTVRDFAALRDLATIFSALEQRNNVLVHMPELDVEFDFSLINMLQTMGLETAFDPNSADLLGLVESSPNNLFISAVQQVVRIIVDKDGTEAAAVTMIAVNTTSMPPPPSLILDFNTPYIYAIYDLSTEIPLFIGIVDNIPGTSTTPSPQRLLRVSDVPYIFPSGGDPDSCNVNEDLIPFYVDAYNYYILTSLISEDALQEYEENVQSQMSIQDEMNEPELYQKIHYFGISLEELMTSPRRGNYDEEILRAMYLPYEEMLAVTMRPQAAYLNGNVYNIQTLNELFQD
ncbi:MAG: hypothetical protein LBI27_08460 [Clostridiales bacterium]|nr:hypothetical protein [Clostridiales bacterium]